MSKNLKSKHITIETTNKCPAKCPICPREKYEHPLQLMNMNLFKKIIDDVSQYQIEVLDLCGFGEPFTDKFLFERCQYAKNKIPDIKIYISSTGNLMNKAILSDVCEYIDLFKFSFYGMTKKIYEYSHGTLNFEKSLFNIIRLLARKDRPYIEGLLVLNDYNKDQMKSWIDFWQPLCDEIMVWNPHNWAGLRDYREIDHRNQKSCGRPFDGPLYVHVDGTVSPCCWDINRKMKIGDMNTMSIDDVFHSKSFEFVQENHRNRTFENLLCYQCEQTNDSLDACVYSNNMANVGILTATKGKLNRLEIER